VLHDFWLIPEIKRVMILGFSDPPTKVMNCVFEPSLKFCQHVSLLMQYKNFGYDVESLVRRQVIRQRPKWFTAVFDAHQPMINHRFPHSLTRNQRALASNLARALTLSSDVRKHVTITNSTGKMEFTMASLALLIAS